MNWRPLILSSVLIAQKVWDDNYLCNADFAFIYPFFDTDDINVLEIKFLEILNYDVTVKQKLYAQYYFEMRSLFKIDETEFPLRVLTRAEYLKLELNTKHKSLLDKLIAKSNLKTVND